MLSFNQIPLGLRTPGQYVEFDSSRATSGAGVQPHRALVIGQKLAAGTAPAGQSIRITTAGQAVQKFGRGSMLAAMCAAWLANNPAGEMEAYPLADNPAGVAATKTITVTGVASAPGTLNLYVAGQRVQTAIAVADDAEEVGIKIAAAVQAALDLPVTAQANDAGVVTLTARHKGEAGNDIDVRVNYRSGEATPAGLALVIASGVNGTGNPDVTTLFAGIGDDWFNSFVLPYTDEASLDAFDAELASRWGPLRMIEGVAYTFKSGAYGALSALGAERNGPHVSIGGMKGSPTPPWAFAAAYAAQVAASGSIDPARPFQTLSLVGVLAPKVTDRFSREERDLLLRDGISTFVVDAGENVLIERPITTYRTNPYGLEDEAYLDVNTLLTLGYLRWSARNRIATKFPRHKLADDGVMTAPGQAVVTPKVLKAELVSLYRDWMELGLVENLERFKAELVIERDENDPNRINALIPPDLVNQFRVFAAQVQFHL